MANSFESISAFVLTGGRSTRMGEDKALLQLPDGRTLLEHALALASSVAHKTSVVGSRERYAPFAGAAEIVEDIFPGHGPLGGIHAALNATSTELNLIIAVDMPHLSRPLLEFLLQRAFASDALIIVPKIGGRLQPLCAVYRREFASVAEPALRAGRNKLYLLFDPARTLIIEEHEFTSHGIGLNQFANVNTPDEFRVTVQGELEVGRGDRSRGSVQ